MSGRRPIASTGEYRDVALWCHEGQHYAVLSGWVDSQGAVHVSPRVLGEHRELHATERAA